MTGKSTDSDGGTDISTSRRGWLKLLGVGSVGALLGSSSTASAGEGSTGSDVPDELAAYQKQAYQGPLSERPSPGVTGREWEVDDPGHDKHGAVYVDRGDHWELDDRQLGSLSTEEVSLEDTESGQSVTMISKFGMMGVER